MAGIATAIIAGGAGLIGNIFAAKAQTNAANRATDVQQQMFQTARAGEQPFINTGQAVLPTLQKLLTPGPSQTDTLKQLPGFQFASDWGRRMVENLGTTTGLGGNTLASGAEFATGLAQQNWGTLIDQLQKTAVMGANAGANVGQQAVQTGGQIGGNIVGAGNAIGGAATASGSTFANTLMTAGLLRQLGGAPGNMYGPFPTNPETQPSLQPTPFNPLGSLSSLFTR